MLNLVADIQRFLGRLEGLEARPILPELRRGYRVLALHGSCAIEGNTLNLEQVRTIIAGQKIFAPAKDVLEIQNANRLYEMVPKLSPSSERDFLKAHKILMENLIEESGKFRKGNVGIFKGEKVAHIGPKAQLVPKLMQDLFHYIRDTKDIPKLITASVVHYEIEFIHPFADGNGRMGRFWQHLVLARDNPIFSLVPFESVIKQRQSEYYKALSAADRAGESTVFIEFSLTALLESMTVLWDSYKTGPETAYQRRLIAQQNFQGNLFARKDYIQLFKGISSATASRDLTEGVADGSLQRLGDKARTRYHFKNH
jgi:Fic family protein